MTRTKPTQRTHVPKPTKAQKALDRGQAMTDVAAAERAMVRTAQRAVTEDKRAKATHSCDERIKASMALQANPFDSELALPVVNCNNVPSLEQTPIRMTSTGELNVQPNAGVQITLMPGHNGVNPEAPEDPSAFHCSLAKGVGTELFTWGPLQVPNVPVIEPLAGFIEPVGLNAAIADLSAVNLVAAGLRWDNPAPYQGASSGPTTDNTHHSRWQVTGIGIRLINETEIDKRGGKVLSVAPDKPFNSSTQKSFQRFKSALPTTDANTGTYEVSVALRQLDMAMWHPYNAGAVSQSIQDASLHLFISNPTTSVQVYSYQIVMTFALAGTSLRMVTQPHLTYPSDALVVKPAQEIMQTHAHSAHDSVAVANSVSAHLSRATAQVAGKFRTSAGSFVHQLYKGALRLPRIGRHMVRSIAMLTDPISKLL